MSMALQAGERIRRLGKRQRSLSAAIAVAINRNKKKPGGSHRARDGLRVAPGD